MTEEYPEKIIECIDEHFPKGDKRRGDALVLQAVAFLEGKELQLKEVGKVIDEVIVEEEGDSAHDLLVKAQIESQLKQKLGIK